MPHVVHPFDPVFAPDSRVLILGSLPSVRSRAEGFYYGHPQNRFWPLMAMLFDEPLPITIADKQGLMLRHQLALWDVIGACDIEGSADATVRNAVAVDVARVLAQADIRRILCNGTLSAKLYRTHLLPQTGIEAITLPSTSPANAAWSMARLLPVWKSAVMGEACHLTQPDRA